MANVHKTVFKKDNVRVPIKVHLEYRKDHRFSIAKRSAILRMPIWYLKGQRQKTYTQFLDWIESHYTKKPEMFLRFEIKEYQTGDILEVFGVSYRLEVFAVPGDRVSAKLIEEHSIIELSIPKSLEDNTDRGKHISNIIKKVVAKGLKPKVEQRLSYLAKNVVGVRFNNFRLKDSLTNWGSCSGKNNINISIRTLLLPMDKIDYVLIHELCHLKELNHSPEFWGYVEKAMPNYKEAESWITTHGGSLHY